MKVLFTISALLAVACSTCLADSWSLKPETKQTAYEFGDVRIVLHYDSTQDRSFPKYTLEIYSKGELVGKYQDVGFEQLFASPDNAFFLGVSNSGLVKQAYVIFDRKGRILKRQPHDPRAVHYVSVSKTLKRKWYDADQPAPGFTVVEGELKGVRINGCDGSRRALMFGEDLRLETFLLEHLLKGHARPKETCYVSLGRDPGEAKRGTARCDPPKPFLRLFENRPYRVKPVSAYPKPKGNEPWPQDNPQTGAPDGIYTVEIVRWLDEDTAKVEIEMFRNGLWAYGERLVVERRNGQWSIKERGDVWVS